MKHAIIDKTLDMASRKLRGSEFVHFDFDFDPRNHAYTLEFDTEIPSRFYNHLLNKVGKISADDTPDEFDVDPRFFDLVATNKHFHNIMQSIFQEIKRRTGRTIVSTYHEIDRIRISRKGAGTKMYVWVKGIGDLQ